GVVAAEHAGRRDGDEDPIGVTGIQEDRVQAHAPRARLPRGGGGVCAQSRQLLPCLPAVARAEQRGILDAGVDDVGIGERRLEMPDADELPGPRRPVVPEVRAGGSVVGELVPDRFPRLAPVVRALDQLTEPAAGLRGVESVRIGGRSLDVVHLPAAEVRPTDVPLLARAVGLHDERALARADQYPYSAHALLLPCPQAQKLRWLRMSADAAPRSGG